MDLFKYFMGFLIVIIIGQVYNKYKSQLGLNTINDNNYLINKYLLNGEDDIEDFDINIDQKPLLWVYYNTEYNSRKWKSFYSRSSYDLNQPYINFCINTIVEKCGDSFNIFLINDDSFSDIIPEWNISLSKIPDPIKTNYRTLAFCKLLYKYGGMVLPASFLCKKDLSSLYNNHISNNGIFTAEIQNDIFYSDLKSTKPSFTMLGSQINSNYMFDIIKNLEINCSREYTNENKFLGTNEDILRKHINQKTMTVIDGKYIGTKTNENKVINIDNLLSDSYINFNDNMYGILIPSNEILSRTKYQWFAVSHLSDIIDSNYALSKHMLLNCN